MERLCRERFKFALNRVEVGEVKAPPHLIAPHSFCQLLAFSCILLLFNALKQFTVQCLVLISRQQKTANN